MAALLGLDGRLHLEREFPDPATLRHDDVVLARDAFDLLDPAFWSGDFVRLTGDALPFDGMDVPDGTAQWGGLGPYERGPTRAHVTQDADQFWQDSDTVTHWEEGAPVTEATYWIHIDEMDRVSFHGGYSDALSRQNPVPIQNVKFSDITMEAAKSETDFLSQWRFVCNLRSWTFETDAAAVDATPVGTKFGEAVKSLVTGGGTLDFMVDRRDQGWNALSTMRLALLTQKGSKGYAEFFLTQDDSDECGLNGMAIYYAADVLLTSCSLSVRIEEALAGSAAFSTTGAIRLRVAPPVD